MLCHEEDNIFDLETSVLSTPGTSQEIYRNKGNITDKESNNYVLTSFPTSISNSFVDKCTQTDITIASNNKVLIKYKKIQSSSKHISADETDVTNNDAFILQSVSDTFPEVSVNACTVEDIASEMQDDMDDVNEMDEDIENIVLHEDGNIDVDRLRPAEISGRSIIDLRHVFAELQRLSSHWINECRFTDLVITKTKRHGLKTQYFVKCQMCHFRDSFWSEPTADNILDVNRGAVCGTILTGTGHKQLEEFLGA